ncbi:carboxypeptidase-like regulatory domain-containing protein [Planctomycetaceae bacterium SH139]
MIIQGHYLSAAMLLDISLKATCMIFVTIVFDWFYRHCSAALPLVDQLDRPNQKAEVYFRKDGFSPHYNPQQKLGEEDLKVILGKRSLIEGVVRDAACKPASNVEVRSEHGPHQADGVMIGFVVDSTTTDAQGRYRLYVHPESYRILVRSSLGLSLRTYHERSVVGGPRRRSIPMSVSR